ncbi:MAG: hypothetical protein M3N98_07200 [Actinomycetota bacterium]|nr:hypothetical protein [Actinomycetota bacterium]
MRIRRQLAQTEGLVRWASVVAGPREFWTVTVWRSRHDMLEFMRSGAHEDIMWMFSKWLESFWLMRWRPGATEIGLWQEVSLAEPDPAPDAPTVAQSRALNEALAHLPRLRAATGSDGAASYDATPLARRRRAEVGQAGGVVVQIRTSRHRTGAALRALRSLRRTAEDDSSCLRVVVGLSRLGEVYMLTLCRERAGAQRLLESPALNDLAQRWPAGCWAHEWIPENEFGHWDGLRLRRTRQRSTIRMPAAALAALDSDAEAR